MELIRVRGSHVRGLGKIAGRGNNFGVSATWSLNRPLEEGDCLNGLKAASLSRSMDKGAGENCSNRIP